MGEVRGAARIPVSECLAVFVVVVVVLLLFVCLFCFYDSKIRQYSEPVKLVHTQIKQQHSQSRMSPQFSGEHSFTYHR